MRIVSKEWIEKNELDHLQILRGSFSAVSKPIFASKDSAIDYFRVLPKWQNSEVIDDAVFSYQIVPSLREGQKAA